MATTIVTPTKTVRSKRRANSNPMTKLEIVQKMLADQKIISEALQNSTSLIELEKPHGYKFARL